LFPKNRVTSMFIPKVALWIYTVDIEDSFVLDLKKNSWIFSASTLEKKKQSTGRQCCFTGTHYSDSYQPVFTT
jgi:hypothetical protein